MEARTHAGSKAAALPCFTPAAGGLLQRKCACGGPAGLAEECEGCSEQKLSLQRSTQDPERGTRDADGVPPIVNEVLSSPGQPLDSETRAFMEPRFGHDFSRVRVHKDASSAEAAQAVGAKAFAVGESIFFGHGMYSPGNTTGRELLAHELAHVAQNYQGDTGTGASAALRISHPADTLEREAEAIASKVVMGTPEPHGHVGIARTSSHTELLLRDENEGEAAQASDELQSGGESPCERSSLKDERDLPCPGSNDRSTWLMLDCVWTMFKNTGSCPIGVAHMNSAGEFPMIDFIDPGETSDVHPISGCTSLVVTCMPDCSGKGHVKWGPPCIS